MTVKKLGGWESLDCELLPGTYYRTFAFGLSLIYAWLPGSEIFKLKGVALSTG